MFWAELSLSLADVLRATVSVLRNFLFPAAVWLIAIACLCCSDSSEQIIIIFHITATELSFYI